LRSKDVPKWRELISHLGGKIPIDEIHRIADTNLAVNNVRPTSLPSQFIIGPFVTMAFD